MRAPGPMIAGPRMTEFSTIAPASTTTIPSTREALSTRPSMRQRFEDQPVGLEHVLEFAGVFPPSRHQLRRDAQAAIDQVLDSVGDLQLVAQAGLDCLHRRKNLRPEHVNADE